ncbi:MAG TPA: exosortase V [Caulobacteraceae bacterium]|nr:exosortase V [Caulobacteraceae bacterium]
MAIATTKSGRSDLFSEVWVLGIGFAVLAIPTLIGLATNVWSRDNGAQGPIVLATGAWLLWREAPALRRDASADRSFLPFALLAVGCLVYVAGRVTDYMTIEAGGLYLTGLAVLEAKLGASALRNAWFPLLYLAFTVPPPDFLLVEVTAPLKQFVTFIATHGLQAVGLPIAHEGVTITIGPYQLLVEDACSGMNSLIGLTAISLLYIYLVRAASPAYSILLTAFVVPIAIVANILRIVALILITYYFGDAVGQSFIHMAAGVFLFAAALLLVFGLDGVLYPVFKRWRRT